MRLALFGGTFDPIHLGHLRVARAAADTFALDRVLFAPTGRQPLKTAAPEASFEDRLAMVALALAIADPRDCNGKRTTDGEQRSLFAASPLDAPRPGDTLNYTVDLLEDLARAHPDAQLFAIAGADSFLTLAQWRSPARVLALAEWIVVSRPGLPLTPDFQNRAEFSLTPEQQSRIHLLTTVHEDISATDLRARLHAAATPSGDDALLEWLPSSVITYIRDHHLYRP